MCCKYVFPFVLGFLLMVAFAEFRKLSNHVDKSLSLFLYFFFLCMLRPSYRYDQVNVYLSILPVLFGFDSFLYI